MGGESQFSLCPDIHSYDGLWRDGGDGPHRRNTLAQTSGDEGGDLFSMRVEGIRHGYGAGPGGHGGAGGAHPEGKLVNGRRSKIEDRRSKRNLLIKENPIRSPISDMRSSGALT